MSEHQKYFDDTGKTPQIPDADLEDCKHEGATAVHACSEQCSCSDEVDLEAWFRALTGAKPE